jgi:hypothetical protein
MPAAAPPVRGATQRSDQTAQRQAARGTPTRSELNRAQSRPEHRHGQQPLQTTIPHQRLPRHTPPFGAPTAACRRAREPRPAPAFPRRNVSQIRHRRRCCSRRRARSTSPRTTASTRSLASRLQARRRRALPICADEWRRGLRPDVRGGARSGLRAAAAGTGAARKPGSESIQRGVNPQRSPDRRGLTSERHSSRLRAVPRLSGKPSLDAGPYPVKPDAHDVG